MDAKTVVRITKRQLEKLRSAPRSPETWKEIGMEISEETIVLVEDNCVRLISETTQLAAS